MRIFGFPFLGLGTVGFGEGGDVREIDGLSLLKEGNVLGRAEGSEDGDSLLIDGVSEGSNVGEIDRASEGIDVGEIDGLKEGNPLGLKLGSEDGR